MTTLTTRIFKNGNLIKNKPPSVAERINALDPEDKLCMSYFTCAELLKGAEGSTRKNQVLKQLYQLTQIITIDYTASADLCQHYAAQFNKLKSAGTPIGCNDLWIACHALSINATIITHNVREFERITGLRVEDWAV